MLFRSNGRYFVNVAAMGSLVDVSQKTDPNLKNTFGVLSYYIKGASEIAKLKPIPITVESEEFSGNVDILEVFYAHTISPICIAVIVSACVILFVGTVSSWYLALIVMTGFITVGIILPVISSAKLKSSGVRYRSEFATFNAYFLDSIKGIKDIVFNNAGKEREREVNRRSELLLTETKKMKHDTAKASADTELCVSVFIIAALAAGIFLVVHDKIGRAHV